MEINFLFVAGLILFFGLLILLYFLLKRFNIGEYPYYKNPYFISQAERSFFRVLQNIVGDKYYIFCQVNVHSLFRINKEGKEYWEYFNKIRSKSIDFVLVDKQSFSPVLAIELDDMSHTLYDRSKSDFFKNEAFKAAGIPLLRIKNKRFYNVVELKQSLREFTSV